MAKVLLIIEDKYEGNEELVSLTISFSGTTENSKSVAVDIGVRLIKQASEYLKNKE